MQKHNLPLQSAPVTRYVSPAAVDGGAGVEACGIWDDIKSGVSSVINSPIAQAAAKAAIGAITG